jgi:hypothetical protein
MITVAEQQARRAELVKQREAIDHEIGTIDIRLGLDMSRDEVNAMLPQREARQATQMQPPPKTVSRSFVLAAILLIAASVAVQLMLSGYWKM